MIFQEKKLLAEISTFGIGGPARFFLEVSDVETMQLALQTSKKLNIPYIVVGKGSNCLFSSQGFDGLVILNKINYLSPLSSTSFDAGSGYSFSLLGTQTAKLNLTGLEFASGIPGSVGGAVFMNAGANGQETSETLTTVTFLHDSGEITLFTKDDLIFSYRTSPFQKLKGIILSATFSLKPLENARQKQLELFHYRKKTQPYGEMSAGCIFRNPKNTHASALIDSTGLKGLQIGHAKVSDLHANFIVNTEKATSDDVLQLIQLIQERVKEKTGMSLQSEVRYIPYDPLEA